MTLIPIRPSRYHQLFCNPPCSRQNLVGLPLTNCLPAPGIPEKSTSFLLSSNVRRAIRNMKPRLLFSWRPTRRVGHSIPDSQTAPGAGYTFRDASWTLQSRTRLHQQHAEPRGKVVLDFFLANNVLTFCVAWPNVAAQPAPGSILAHRS